MTSHAAATLSIDDSFAYVVYRTARVLRLHLLKKMSSLGYDMTPEQWFVLNRVHLRGGQTQNELCESIFSERANISRIIASMEAKGLVVRRPDATDGRVNRVFLTKAGQRAALRIAEMAVEERQKLFGNLSKRDLDTARSVLTYIERLATSQG